MVGDNPQGNTARRSRLLLRQRHVARGSRSGPLELRLAWGRAAGRLGRVATNLGAAGLVDAVADEAESRRRGGRLAAARGADLRRRAASRGENRRRGALSGGNHDEARAGPLDVLDDVRGEEHRGALRDVASRNCGSGCAPRDRDPRSARRRRRAAARGGTPARCRGGDAMPPEYSSAERRRAACAGRPRESRSVRSRRRRSAQGQQIGELRQAIGAGLLVEGCPARCEGRSGGLETRGP